MKKIFLQMPSAVHGNNAVFKKSMDDDPTWRHMKETFSRIGYDLVTADDNKIEDCEWIIFVDATSTGEEPNLKEKIKNVLRRLVGIKIYPRYPTRNLYREAIEHGMEDKMILFMSEGKAVRPENYYPSNWAKFKKILTWDDDLVDNKKFFKIVFTLTNLELKPGFVPFSEKKLLVNISYNKYSSYYAELYSARRRTIAYFDKHYPNDFDLYGFRWGKPITRLQRMFPWLVQKYATYRGKAENKLETLSRYKFYIAYENNGDANGYVTNKLADAICAKCVPIYIGAPNIEKYVDPDVFIDRRKFTSEKELAEFITKITEVEYQKYLEAGKRYLQSEKFKEFLPERFITTFIDILKLTSTTDEKLS